MGKRGGPNSTSTSSVWQGPPPSDLATFSGLLLDLCRKADADTVIVDSLKDAAIGLNDDEVGAGYNRARQTAISGGVEVVELHHNRKAANTGKRVVAIDDLYGRHLVDLRRRVRGSTHRRPGGSHRQPAAVEAARRRGRPHADHPRPRRGRSTVWHTTDLCRAAQAAKGGLTAVDAARLAFETDKPTAAEKEKARRRLDKLANSGLLAVVDEGDVRANRAKRWGAR